MEDIDIKKIRKVLIYRGRSDLADLLKNSVSYLDVTSTFGSRWNSQVSFFEIKSHPSIQAKIDNLSNDDIEEIKGAVMAIYPIKNDEPEIREINFCPDFEIDIEDDLVETKDLEKISFEYIQNHIEKCNNKIREKDFDGAVTNARSLIESICLLILESIGNENLNYDGNLIKLYKHVSTNLNMSPSHYSDDSLKQILSGVISIVNGVSGLRNNYSDSHGTTPSRAKFKIDERHSKLAVNLSKIISEYLYLSYEKFQDKNKAGL